MKELPPGTAWAVLRCAERPEGASAAHVVETKWMTEALCGRQPWKRGMYFQEIFYKPSVVCEVCLTKLEERGE